MTIDVAPSCIKVTQTWTPLYKVGRTYVTALTLSLCSAAMADTLLRAGCSSRPQQSHKHSHMYEALTKQASDMPETTSDITI